MWSSASRVDRLHDTVKQPVAMRDKMVAASELELEHALADYRLPCNVDMLFHFRALSCECVHKVVTDCIRSGKFGRYARR